MICHYLANVVTYCFQFCLLQLIMLSVHLRTTDLLIAVSILPPFNFVVSFELSVILRDWIFLNKGMFDVSFQNLKLYVVFLKARCFDAVIWHLDFFYTTIFPLFSTNAAHWSRPNSIVISLLNIGFEFTKVSISDVDFPYIFKSPIYYKCIWKLVS